MTTKFNSFNKTEVAPFKKEGFAAGSCIRLHLFYDAFGKFFN